MDLKQVFLDYPEVVTFQQMCEMLQIKSKNTGYKLLKNNEIKYTKIGRDYRIAKVSILEYLQIG